LAEAFSLAGIALAMAKRTWLSLVLGCVAALFHPIMALPAISFSILSRLRFRVSLSLTLGAAMLLGIMANVPDGYLPDRFGVMDDVWYALAVQRSPFSFVDHWTAAEYGEVLFLLAILGVTAVSGAESLRRVSLTVLLITTALFGAAYVGSVTHHAVLVQAQTWRVLWVTKIFAIFAVGWMFGHYWGRSRYHNLLLTGLVVVWIGIHSWSGYLGVLLCVLLLSLDRFEHDDMPRSLELASRGVLAVALLLGVLTSPELMRVLCTEETHVGMRIAFVVVPHIGWVFLLIPVVPGGWFVEGKKWQTAALVLVLELLLLSAYIWDRNKTEPLGACLGNGVCLSKIDDYLPKNAVIFWEDSLEIPWLGLRRPHYASFQQAAGLIFNRETALEARRRTGRLEKLGVLDGTLNWQTRPKIRKINHKQSLLFDGLVHLCHDRAVDFLVLKSEFPQACPRVFDEPHLETRYYVYDCSFVRKRFPDSCGQP